MVGFAVSGSPCSLLSNRGVLGVGVMSSMIYRCFLSCHAFWGGAGGELAKGQQFGFSPFCNGPPFEPTGAAALDCRQRLGQSFVKACDCDSLAGGSPQLRSSAGSERATGQWQSDAVPVGWVVDRQESAAADLE